MSNQGIMSDPPSTRPPEERAARTIAFFNEHWETHGVGVWTVEERASGAVIGLAVPENTASRRVMEKIGMHYECDTHLFGLDLAQYAIGRKGD